MKIKKNIEKIGYFWLPNNPEHKLAGILSIEDGGKINLQLHGLFGINPSDQSTLNNFDIILGDVDEDGAITLIDSNYIRSRQLKSNEVKAKNYIESDYILIGVHFPNKNDVKINNFTFRVEGLNDWVGISGIIINNDDIINPSISYIQPKEINIDINNIPINISIIYRTTKKGFMKFHAMDSDHSEIHQDTYLKLSSKNNISFLLFFELAKKIANLLVFAIDKQVSIEEITIQKEGLNILCMNGNKTDFLQDIQVYTNKILHISNLEEVNWGTMIFRYRDIANISDTIGKWLKMYESIDPSLDLYFSTIFSRDKYYKGQFLMLAQALEALHSRTNNKKINFLDRLKILCQEFIDMNIYTQEEMDDFAKKIKDTRNYLTHYDKSKEGRTIADDEYQIYINTMILLLQIHFLKLLGFEQDKIYKFLRFDQ